jgi:hypothetical protein
VSWAYAERDFKLDAEGPGRPVSGPAYLLSVNVDKRAFCRRSAKSAGFVVQRETINGQPIREWLGDRTDVSVAEVLQHVFGSYSIGFSTSGPRTPSAREMPSSSAPCRIRNMPLALFAHPQALWGQGSRFDSTTPARSLSAEIIHHLWGAAFLLHRAGRLRHDIRSWNQH